MKNSAKFVLTLALTVASAASCHKEIAVQGEGSAELTLNPQVDVLTKEPIPGQVFPEGRTIVLSAAYHNGSGSSANYFQGIAFEKSGASWVGGGGSNPKYWPVSGSLDLLAYSADGFTNAPTPGYATKCSESVTLAVPAENNTKQVDILFAGATDKSASGSALSMQFKHAEAVVAFDAKADVAYDGTKNLGVTINSITLNNVKTNGSVTLYNNGTCSWNGGTAGNVNLPGISSGYNVPATYIHNTATEPFGIGKKGILVIPQVPQAATSFTVNYTVHYGKDSSSNLLNKNETFTYNIPSSPNWEAGKEYVYQLYFKQDQILVNSTILPWEVIPGGVTVPDKVSATFKDPGKTDIDLCSSGIPAKLSAGAIVGFDWGDGRYEIIENTTSSEMILNSIPHKYSEAPTDSVNIYVRRGTLDFGEVEEEKSDYYNLFTVYKDEEVLLTLLRYIDLSDPETANCYIVSTAGRYKFKATVKGNSTNLGDVISPTSFEVLWESFGTSSKPDVGDLVKNVSLKNGYVKFEATNNKGNAVIAVKSGGNILWSWHIWLTDKPADQTYLNVTKKMMDRNLGATADDPGSSDADKLKTYGLFYQWGRKDPFLGANGVSSPTAAASTGTWSVAEGTKTVAYSVLNPTQFITKSSSPYDWTSTNNSLWGSGSTKTMYDPCPPGYRVPDSGDTGVWKKAGFAKTIWYRGYNFNISGGTTWFPAAGNLKYDNGTIYNEGQCGYYWGCTTSNNPGVYYMMLTSTYVQPAYNEYMRAGGLSVRCIQE